MSLQARSVAHLTKNQLRKAGGVPQNAIQGTSRYNASNNGATTGGVIAGGVGNPNVRTSSTLATSVPNTTRRRYVVK